MRITYNDKLIAFLALFSGLSISAVAVYYSVAGLISIFAAAVVPIMIMGIVLELGKLVATLWLKQNWFIAPRLIRVYLLISVVILMAITSMGIFGYLSKAHLDQAVPTGDIAAKVAIIDEKIRTQKDNIDVARKALAQMDATVDQTIARSTNEQGANRAAQLRRTQAKERATLQGEIAKAQSSIAVLNDERAPIAQELRKVEAEVGPIKYIAALIYGDNLDQNLLESAVRWMIILIVIIFDPLAIVLLLASQYSFQYFRKLNDTAPLSFDQAGLPVVPEERIPPAPVVVDQGPDLNEINMMLAEAANDAKANIEIEVPEVIKDEIKTELEFDISKHAYLNTPWVWKVPGVEPVGPMVYKPEEVKEPTTVTEDKTEEVVYNETTSVDDSLGQSIKEIEEGYHTLKKKNYMIKSENQQIILTKNE